MRILIAEDDPISMLVLRRTLEKLGHGVESARDGAEAWDLFQAKDFDVVITDWMMPLMDGIELCRRVRLSGREHYPYVIVLTAKGQKEDRLEALNRGADDLMVKPLDSSELRARLEVAARIIGMQNQLHRQSCRLNQLQQAQETSNRRISDLFRRLPNPCITISADGAVMEWNLAAEVIFQRLSEQAWMEPLAQSFDDSVADNVQLLIQRALAPECAEPFELRLVTRSYQSLDLLISTFPLTGPDNDVVGAAIACVDITERKRLEQQIERQLESSQGMNQSLSEQNLALDLARGQLEQLAHTDGLTGLNNYRYLREQMPAVLNSCRQLDEQVCLVLIDVDNFKQYNDTFGHPEGDEVLRRLAHLLQDNVRHATDIVARYGGEEFALLLPRVTVEHAFQIAEQVRQSVERANWPLRGVTISLGVALDRGELDEDLIRAADAALYASKASGRNCTRVAGENGEYLAA